MFRPGFPLRLHKPVQIKRLSVPPETVAGDRIPALVFAGYIQIIKESTAAESQV